MGSQVVLSLLTPYLAYIPAQRLHGSGVLATLAAAAWLGIRGRGLFQPAARVQTEAFWRVLVFLIEATLFVLLGLEVPGIVRGVAHEPAGTLAIASAAVVGTAIGVRLLWQVLTPPLIARFRRTDEVATLPRRERALIGWCGMRGAVSLAIALSIPRTLSDGRPFPERELLLFLTLVVVLVTLIGQGSSLPLVIRWLGVAQSDEELGQGLLGRRVATEAALRELEELVVNGEVSEDSARVLRPLYEARLERLRRRIEGDDVPEAGTEVYHLRLRLLGAQRDALAKLYQNDEIGADVSHEIRHELDLEEARLRRREQREGRAD
jgi:CPA1 family monovalent cation:H+ antiporter